VNAVDRDGWTPLHFVADFGERNIDIEELLLAYNADVNAKANGGFTPSTAISQMVPPHHSLLLRLH